MNGPVFTVALALLAGFLVGTAYFACLWVSVRSLTGPRRPWRVFMAGGLMRISALLTVLAVALWLKSGPVLVLAALPGFLAARMAVTARKAGGP